MQKLLTLLLVWVLFSSILLAKLSNILTTAELRRRARSVNGSKLSRMYLVFSYEAGLRLMIWLVGSLSFSLLLIKLAGSGWVAVLAFILVLGWVVFAWHPKKTTGWYWNYCLLIAPGLSKLLSAVQPLVGKVEKFPTKLWPLNMHVGVYESEDLLKLIKEQKDQPENRIPEVDLRIAYGALAFGGKKIGEVMTPRRKIKMVTAGDAIGPHLLDELHASGFSRFPVVSELTKAASIEVVGTLYLRDLIGVSDGRKVADVMVKDVCFVNEQGSLRQALDGFVKTRHHLLVVVNKFEEVVGVISMEDILEQIFGTKILDEFDSYKDLRQVAAMEASQEQTKHKEVKTTEQTDKTVVE